MNGFTLLSRIMGSYADRRRLCLVLCAGCFFGVTALAQPMSPPAVIGSATVVSPVTDSWSPVTQLAPNTRLKVSATKNGGDCALQSVSASSLVCLHGSTTREVRREDIKSIKLARRGRSGAGGLAIGAGAGAGMGAGVGSAINSSDTGSLLHVSGGKSAGVGAAIGVLVGGAGGALIGYSADFFAGPVIYKR